MYQLNPNGIIRLTDGALIPMAVANADYQAFLAWQSAGNTAQPMDVAWPEPVTPAKARQAALAETRPAFLEDDLQIDDSIQIGEW